MRFTVCIKKDRDQCVAMVIRYVRGWLIVCAALYAGSICLASAVLSMRSAPPVVTYCTYEEIKPYVVNVFGDFAVAQVHVTEVASGGGTIIAESPPSWHRLIKDKLALPRATTGMAYTILVFPPFPLVRATVEVSWGDSVGSLQVIKSGGVEAAWVNPDRSAELYIPIRPMLGNIAIVAGVSMLCARVTGHARRTLAVAFRMRQRLCLECSYPVTAGGTVCPECGSRHAGQS